MAPEELPRQSRQKPSDLTRRKSSPKLSLSREGYPMIMTEVSPSPWDEWLRRAWPNLTSGHKVRAPSWLPHPTSAGFSKTLLAEPVGQIADWARPGPQESRIHIHEYRNGVRIVHLDSPDPSLGPIHALRHWATQSLSGRAFTAIGAGALLAFAVHSLASANK